jgi:hypothetical protein
VVDSVSLATAGYASAGAQPAESVQPLPADNQPPLPAALAVAPQQAAALPRAAAAPSVVVDFANGVAGSYVLDWRDPETQQVLVQLPMRSALSHLAGAANPPSPVGQHVDTEA